MFPQIVFRPHFGESPSYATGGGTYKVWKSKLNKEAIIFYVILCFTLTHKDSQINETNAFP